MNVYDPLGVFKVEDNKVTGDIAIIMAPDPTADDKKFEVEKLKSFDISTGESQTPGNSANGIFLVIKVKRKGGGDVGNLRYKTYPDYKQVKLDTKITSFNPNDEKCRVIVFHSNKFKESEYKDVIDCAKEFIKEHKYDLGQTFEDYCNTKNLDLLEPDTAGGGILVGTGG